jgi:hypothetical protein
MFSWLQSLTPLLPSPLSQFVWFPLFFQSLFNQRSPSTQHNTTHSSLSESKHETVREMNEWMRSECCARFKLFSNTQRESEWVECGVCVCCFVLLVCFPHQSTSWSPLSLLVFFSFNTSSLSPYHNHSSPQTNTKLLKNMFFGTGTICSSHFMIGWSYTLHMILMKVIIFLTYDLMNEKSWVLVVWICIKLFELFDEVWMICSKHDCDEGDHIVNIWLEQWNELSSVCLDLHQTVWVIWWGLNNIF